MGWTDPPKLDLEDKIMAGIRAQPLRDGAITMAYLTFGHLLYGDLVQPSKDHFRDLALATLRMVKHMAEMDLLGFLLKQSADLPEHLDRAEVLRLFAALAAKAGEAADKQAEQAHKLVRLLETKGGTSDASK